MDSIDEKLLAARRETGRASTAMLARLVGRSRTSVQSRIERLEKQGIITGYGVRLAPELGTGAVRAHDLIAVAVAASVAEMDQVIDRIGALDGVERTNSSIILSTKFER